MTAISIFTFAMFIIIKAIIATINIIAVIILNIPFVMSGNIVDGDSVIIVTECFFGGFFLLNVFKRYHLV